MMHIFSKGDAGEIVDLPAESTAAAVRAKTNHVLDSCRSSMVPGIGGTLPQIVRLMLKRMQFALGLDDG